MLFKLNFTVFLLNKKNRIIQYKNLKITLKVIHKGQLKLDILCTTKINQ